MNNITIEFSKTDRALLKDVVAHLGLLVGLVGDKTTGTVADTAPQESQEIPGQTVHPVEEVSPEPVAEPEPPKYTKDDVLAKVQTLATPGHPKREEAKAVIKSYGTKVSDIPEDKYVEVMDKLIALEG